MLTGFLFANQYITTNQINFTNRIRVIKSLPVYKNFIKRTPYRECYNIRVRSNQSNGTIGALIGGVAGGIIGHQVGGGSGKTAATVGGAILGTLVGRNLSDQKSTYQNQRRCITKYNETRETILTGYKNIGVYDERQIIKYSLSPLRFIQINISISW